MNIFFLDTDPKKASEYHTDKHVVKMTLETAQLLCTIHWLLGNEAPYKPTHKHHPCIAWLQKSINNYNWLISLGLHLAKEYTHRYGKTHKSEQVILWCKNNTPKLPNVPMTEPALAMPLNCIEYDAVSSYRKYYNQEKPHLHKWTKRSKPEWIINNPLKPIIMTNSEKEIYIKVRAEQIKHFQDTRNGHLFTKPYSIELAKEIATNQLNYDLSVGKLRITLEELLLNNDETCISIIQNHTISKAKQLIA